MLAYFGYGTNRDHDMMAAMIGRENLEGEEAVLPGYELVIQNLENISDTVLPTAPVPKSAREILGSALGKEARLYIIRSNPDAETYGTIWQLSELEYEMVRDWELLDFGMQEDLQAQARTKSGRTLQIQTHGSRDPNLPASVVIYGSDYEDYIVKKNLILETARRVNKEFRERIESQT